MKRARKIICSTFIFLLCFNSLIHCVRLNVSAASIDPEIELQIRSEYAATKENLTIDDVKIGSYYGNYGGREVISLDVKYDFPINDVGVVTQIGGYVFEFGDSRGYAGFCCWKPGEFIHVKNAYESGLLSREDVYEIGRKMGTIPAKEDVPYADVDIENDWFGNYVYDTYTMGLMTGLDYTTFAPYELLSRAQFAMIICRIQDINTSKLFGPYKDTFYDVKINNWYSRPVIWNVENGIVTGYENGYFGPADPITREQLAAMLYRYSKFREFETSNRIDLDSYPDASDVSDFAKEAMSWCVAEGIISGNDGKLLPQGNATRAECAAMISRYMEIYG